MSDWLERELARGLAPVTAPETLGIRLGFAPARRSQFPRVVLAVAAAVVVIIGGGYAASRSTALDPAAASSGLRHEAGLPRCAGAATPSEVNAAKASVLLAHSGSEIPAHTLAASEAGCHLCHSL